MYIFSIVEEVVNHWILTSLSKDRATDESVTFDTVLLQNVSKVTYEQ